MKKHLIYSIGIIAIIAFATSCQYKFIVEPVVPPPDPTDTVYFSQEIIPIWNDEDNCISCHKTGGTKPDLTTDNAYNEIMKLNLVDTENPGESLIYIYPHPDTDTHTWKKYTNSQAALVLQWIEQGALDN